MTPPCLRMSGLHRQSILESKIYLQSNNRKHIMAITQARLKELLNYEPDTGVFTWRVSPSNRVAAGSKAGAPGSSGYWSIQIARKLHLSHRLAWLFMTGLQPTNCVDHINGKRADNRFSNLREATHCQNLQNQKVRSPFTGVHLHGRGWRAKITANRAIHILGTFATHAEAHAAYLAAKQQLHGEYAR